ncbi:dihydrolipoamide acetyltransferase family protein [Halomarina pelagica]|uniref:dihydrolipoamide acetyltransferase family protein n=1 Tax=Halomarina pelagica TaxID=2961599 RepID=UPI0020C3DBDB|nr:dihydrolipoamide acetyltransferase family protein [Halomarina sp. BND7]
MATREFKLPDVGEGLTEAEIVGWLVEEGDAVTEDQPVAEAETDKAVVEVPSPVDGTVKEIRAEAGEVVPVGEVIIVFETEGGEAAEEPETGRPEPEAAAGAAEEVPGGGTEEVSTPEGRVFAAPSARRLARELGVDIAEVEGSGPGGRVGEADVRAHAEGAGEAEASQAPEPEAERGGSAAGRASDDGAGAGGADVSAPAASAVEVAERDRTLAAPATRRLAEERGVDLNAVPTDEERDGRPFVAPEQVVAYAEAQEEAQAADAAAIGAAPAGVSPERYEAAEDERVPYRGIRRTIGAQMARSKYTAPHVTHHDEVDVTELVAVRSELKEVAAERGVSLTYMPFVIRAVVAALREFPYLNSTLDEEAEEIVLRKDYNVGVAVATDAGLMVPVIRNADRKGMLRLSSELSDLVEKARERTISREEMQGGTFTITNFGAIGGEYATPIINYPETAILGLGAIKKKPRVVESDASGAHRENGTAVSGEVVPRYVMTLSLSIDHRVIDGAQAAAFTNRVMEYLEDPSLLLLE